MLAIDKVSVPIESEVFKSLKGAYFSDSYRFCSKKGNRLALQVWIDHATQVPTWVNFLMASRNKIVSLFGLNNIGHLGDIDTTKPIPDYQVGDRVGIFTIRYLSETEIILGDSDKHLDVLVSVYVEKDKAHCVSMSTVVHVHNLLGMLYMLFVTPMHKLIVPASIKRAEG